MTRFSVWAPRPQRVDAIVDGNVVAMQRDDNDWWSADVANAGPGTTYAFSLDGGPPRPDPRSCCQPNGIEPPSVVYDHTAFAWHDTNWSGIHLAGAVLYELHIGTFSPSGTFDGALANLPHLVELGIDAVELMPVATASGSRGWGYDGVDLYAPSAAYGGPDGLKRFVDGCHAAGIGVIVDVVYNHLGPAGNFLAEFGPYFTSRHRTPWGDAVNFDGKGSAEVRRFVVDNACMWLRDFHADGLRLDAVHAIIDDSPRHILAELAGEVATLERELGRSLVIIAESDANDRRIVSPPPDGYGLDAVWSDDWHHALHTVLTGEHDGYYADFGTLDDLAKALRQAWVYDGVALPTSGRVRGTSTHGLPAQRFVVATQNHDQIGNRAQGERLGMLVDEQHARIAAALLLTTPFVPMLFQGEEWNASTPFLYFTDHADPGLGRAVRDGRRSEFAAFGWAPENIPDPQALETFERSVLDWAEIAHAPHAEMLAFYRQLIALRRSTPDLRDPTVPAVVSIDDRVLRFERGSITVLANLASDARHVTVDAPMHTLLGDASTTVDGNTVALPAGALVVLQTTAADR